MFVINRRALVTIAPCFDFVASMQLVYSDISVCSTSVGVGHCSAEPKSLSLITSPLLPSTFHACETK